MSALCSQLKRRSEHRPAVDRQKKGKRVANFVEQRQTKTHQKKKLSAALPLSPLAPDDTREIDDDIATEPCKRTLIR